MVLIYPIQFEANPLDAVDRVVNQIIPDAGIQAPPGEYVVAISSALQHADEVVALLPLRASKAAVCDYLREVQRRLLAGQQR
jgi:hypothetical protein